MATAEKLVDYAKSIFAAFASLSATAFFARSILNEMLPREVVEYTKSIMESILSNKFRKEITLTIDELHGCETNQIFKAAELYLGTHIRNSSALVLAQSLKVSKISEDMPITVGLDSDQEIVDEFEGVKFYWVLKCERIKHTRGRTEVRTFNLKFPRSNKEMALEKYIPYILNEADLIKKGARKIKLFTLTNDVCIGHQWESTNLNHPATLETLALDPELKQMLFDDLDRFLSRKKYYRQVGKAWKRGYLLYGPPGTGKSSLIAAMANYLKFDVYDLDLGMLKSDSQLRTILLETANRSILVVEDIDCCSVDVQVREDSSDEGHPPKGEVTLSGLLNFIDGLWSSCGDERIIIFTTNHKDKLDPALLRPGRMDMHINMSNCTPSVFRILVDNYLGVKSHELFEEIERLIEEKEFTPAEIAEQLMKDDDPNSALQGLLCFLGSKKIETAAVFEKIN